MAVLLERVCRKRSEPRPERHCINREDSFDGQNLSGPCEKFNRARVEIQVRSGLDTTRGISVSCQRRLPSASAIEA